VVRSSTSASSLSRPHLPTVDSRTGRPRCSVPRRGGVVGMVVRLGDGGAAAGRCRPGWQITEVLCSGAQKVWGLQERGLDFVELVVDDRDRVLPDVGQAVLARRCGFYPGQLAVGGAGFGRDGPCPHALGDRGQVLWPGPGGDSPGLGRLDVR
jgi:hypothetical protein